MKTGIHFVLHTGKADSPGRPKLRSNKGQMDTKTGQQRKMRNGTLHARRQSRAEHPAESNPLQAFFVCTIVRRVGDAAMSDHDQLILELRNGFQGLSSKLDETNARLDQTNARLDQTNARLARQEDLLQELRTDVNNGFSGIGKYLQSIDRHLERHDVRLTRLERRVDRLEGNS